MPLAAWIALGTLSLLLISAIGGAVVGAIKLTWWLSAQFADVKKVQSETLKTHEGEDQRRHEENIERFGLIEAALNGRPPSRRRFAHQQSRG